MFELERALCKISGMDAVTLQPAAGAHGEFTGMLIVKAYHAKRGDKRIEVIVPDAPMAPTQRPRRWPATMSS